MAANNYFGFTHGGTQYGAATASAAYGGQTGYAVAPAATAATYGTQRAAATGYDTAYQAAAATQAAAHAHAQAAAAAASAYDASKSAYYQQAYPAPPQQPAYDAAKPAYTTPATYAQVTTTAYAAHTAHSAHTAPVSYQGGARAGGGAKAYGGVYTATTAATSYPTQPYSAPAAQPAKLVIVAESNVARGKNTYKEHLEGQKHKKKEAAVKMFSSGGGAGGAGGAGGGGAGAGGGRGAGGALRCELCDVTCTGADAFAAHVRGIKHQKVLKLHTMLGKPIPPAEPAKIHTAKKTVAGTPKIAFVASGELSSVASGEAEGGACADKDGDDEEGEPEPEVQPVGQDYIEEIRGDDGKALSFNCKLCDCKFNDPNAKEMHMKGRRHRLQYKKKVQPDLEVKVKPSTHQRKLAEAKAQRMMGRDDMWARRRLHDGIEDEERVYWDGSAEAWWGRGPLPPHMHHHHHQGLGAPYGTLARRGETADDRHVLARHADIYPTEEELETIQRVVSQTERALKSLSDALADANKAKQQAQPNKAPPKPEDKKDDKPEGKEDGRDNQLFSFAGEGEVSGGGGGGSAGAGGAGGAGAGRARWRAH
ncbi:Zinc finger RNA-binding protein 2 [Papilio xuthus]|uniref:Zinc finger RNA-binding protein 2 n=1 Tax=Papilio xuthus TaxID=66420 RepID=A0A194PUH1_PAPXU|nr:Zinc finger RNA-binding protein 2 [Papilio xuthus]